MGTSRRRVDVTGSGIAGRMKPTREQRQRGRSAAAAEIEKDSHRQLEWTLGRKLLEIEILKTSWGSALR